MREKKAINIQIGANIQTARERANYTQEELSELLGLTPNHLSAIERGVSGISLDALQKLCRLLGISADALLFGEPETDEEVRMLTRQIAGLEPSRRARVKRILSTVLELSSL